jgi:hypothetical protein
LDFVLRALKDWRVRHQLRMLERYL